MTETVWFRRADGLEFEAAADSAEHRLMAAQENFTQISGPEIETPAKTEGDGLDAMAKTELLAAAAADQGIEVKQEAVGRRR